MNSYEVLGRFIVRVLIYLMWTCSIGAISLLGTDDDTDYATFFFIVAWFIGAIVYAVSGLI